MLFALWLRFGYKRGWISNSVCQTHDGVPMSAEEVEDFEENDPCVHILRLYPDRETKNAVEANESPNVRMYWLEDKWTRRFARLNRKISVLFTHGRKLG